MHAHCFGLRAENQRNVKRKQNCCLFTVHVPHQSVSITKAVVYVYSHRNDIIIESVQFLANPHVVSCLEMIYDKVIWNAIICVHNHCYGLPIFVVNRMTLATLNNLIYIIFAVYMGA